jgi:uncharacterized protein (TIGR02117 family)
MANKRWSWKRVLGTLVSIVIGVPSLYVLAAFGLAFIPVNSGFVEPPPGVGIEIQLISNGIHVDFLLPARTTARNWSQDFPLASFAGLAGESDPQAWPYVLVGWGDRAIYTETPTWSDLKVSTALKAVFWPTPSALHVQYLRNRFQEDEGCRNVRVTEAAYRKLCEYIDESVEHDLEGRGLLIPQKGYGPTDNFYEGRGSYHAFNTCNSWASRGLARMGLPTALWSPFTFGVLRHLP